MQPGGWFGCALVVALTCVAGIASSNSGGRTGRSGKDGSTCASCHQGGVVPKVELTGPTSLDAGMLAVYTFRIETNAAITGMNAASTDGVLFEADGGFTSAQDGEIVHGLTLAPDGGSAVYTFSMTAPDFGGTVTLFAAGNACDNNGQTDGDETAATKLDITVNGPPRPPAPEAGPPATPPPSPPIEDASVDAGSDDGSSGGTAAPTDEGCAIGWADRSSLPAGAVFGSLLALAAVMRGRARRRR